MIRPWNEWILIVFPSPEWGTVFKPTEQDYLRVIRERVGGPSDIPIKLNRVSKWQVNETFALEYRKGLVFGAGDAVHRHPPMNALGSNTCVQDAFNLAWKMAYVLKGIVHKWDVLILRNRGS
jgi:2-polyprenyl-6-methoxyphenol hydroxylase-like FAD-dependent oxidoreductase